MPVKVSVIMPVYNAADFLRDGLDTVLAQTLTSIEIICVDDGSTDGSPEILREYAQKDARLHVVRQENGGAGKARNTGLALAKGEYLSFLDADDLYAPDMLEKLCAAADAQHADVTVCACDFHDSATGQRSPCDYSIHRALLPGKMPFAGTDVPRDLFKLFVGWPWDKLFRAEFIRAHGLQYQEQRTTNDMVFVFMALTLAKRIFVLDDVLVHHRRAAGTLSVTREKSWHCFYDALCLLRQQLKACGLYARFERDFLNYCVHFSLWNLNTLAEPTRTALYKRLQQEWFAALGVTMHGIHYYYNRYEYLQYRRVMDHPADWQPTESDVRRLEKQAHRNLFQRCWDDLLGYGAAYTVRKALLKLQRRREA